ncbi:MAG TPA: DoxX family membrane protein [bacterium]|nr:DoxX family membrane protein [bacterium]
MKFCEYDARRFFLFGMRVYFAIWLLYVGITKWVAIGPSVFVGYITSDFDKTWSPHLLNTALAWLILVAEPVLALLILSGKKARAVWMLTSLLMFMLTLGQTILMKPDVIANWQYLVLTLACAALSDPGSKKIESAA